MLVAPERVAYLNVSAAEEGVLRLIDGTRAVPQVLEAAMTLDVPVPPDAVIDLLERLHRAGMLLDEQQARTSLFGAVAGAARHRAGVSLAALRFVAAPGAMVPRAMWQPAFGMVALATVVFALWALVSGRTHTMLSPFHPDAATAAVLGATWLGASIALSLRAMLRAWVMRSHGLDVPGAGVQVTAGIAHLSTDIRDLRGAPRDVRTCAAQAGLAAFTLAALVGGTLSWDGGSVLTRGLSSAAWLLLAMDAAPYLRTDARNLLGIATRVRGLGRHALGYVFRGVGARGALGRDEGAFAAAATLAVVHGLALLAITGLHIMPDAVDRAILAVFGTSLAPTGAIERSLAVLTAVGSLGVVVALLALMLSGVARTLWELVRPQPAPTSRTPQPAGPADAAAIAGSRAIAVLASEVSAQEVEALAAAAQVVGYDAGDRLTAVGHAERWLGVILAGAATVYARDVSGVDEQIVRLGAGDFYGLGAFTGADGAPFTIIADAPTRVAVLTPDAAGVVSAAVRDALAERLRLVQTLRELPAARGLAASRFAELVANAQLVELATGVTRQLDPDDERGLWVVQSGSIEVSGGDEGLSPSTLRAGDTAGVFASTNVFAAGRDVVASEPAVLVHVPFGEVRAALLTGAPAVVELSRRRAGSTAASSVVGGRQP